MQNNPRIIMTDASRELWQDWHHTGLFYPGNNTLAEITCFLYANFDEQNFDVVINQPPNIHIHFKNADDLNYFKVCCGPLLPPRFRKTAKEILELLRAKHPEQYP